MTEGCGEAIPSSNANGSLSARHSARSCGRLLRALRARAMTTGGAGGLRCGTLSTLAGDCFGRFAPSQGQQGSICHCEPPQAAKQSPPLAPMARFRHGTLSALAGDCFGRFAPSQGQQGAQVACGAAPFPPSQEMLRALRPLARTEGAQVACGAAPFPPEQEIASGTTPPRNDTGVYLSLRAAAGGEAIPSSSASGALAASHLSRPRGGLLRALRALAMTTGGAPAQGQRGHAPAQGQRNPLSARAAVATARCSAATRYRWIGVPCTSACAASPIAS